MTEWLDTLLTKEHRVRPGEARRLDARVLRELVDVARGRRDPSHQVRALGLLAVMQGDQAVPVLSQVALAADQDVPARAAAAAQLGRTSVSATEPLMRLAQSETDPTVLVATVGALARVGGPEALDPLDELSQRVPELTPPASFAATVVAFRHRLPGREPSLHEAPDLAPVPEGQDVVPVHEYLLRGEEAASAITDLRGDGYGVRLRAESAWGVRCQGERLVVALDEPLANAGDRMADLLAEGPLLAGLVGLQSPVDPGYAVRWLVLTWTDGDQQQLAVHRPAGPAALLGTAQVDGPDARFALRAVSAPGSTPVVVRGTLSHGRLTLEGVSASTRLRPRRPAPLG